MSLALMWLLVAGSFLLALDFLILVIYLIWRKKKNDKERNECENESQQLMEFDPNEMTKKNLWSNIPSITLTTSSDIDGFLIPGKTVEIDGDNRRLLQNKDHFSKKHKNGYLDASHYTQSPRKSYSGTTMISLELFYFFRLSELQITIKKGKQFFNFSGEQYSISVMMSNSSLIYHTNLVNGPDPVFNESFRFPLDSSLISADPPVKIKLNIWSTNKYSEEKKPFGVVEASVEELIVKHGFMPAPGKEIWQNVTRCTNLIDNLKDEDLVSEIFVHLGYLSAARRIVVVLGEVKNLKINSNDKNILGKVSLIYRDCEKKAFISASMKAASNINFHEEFVFHLSEFPTLGIDGLAICIELQVTQNKYLSKPRVLGSVTIGNSVKAERGGREHWAKMLTSGTSISKRHIFREPYLLTNE